MWPFRKKEEDPRLKNIGATPQDVVDDILMRLREDPAAWNYCLPGESKFKGGTLTHTPSGMEIALFPHKITIRHASQSEGECHITLLSKTYGPLLWRAARKVAALAALEGFKHESKTQS